ncbi:hypothetical protein HYZ05_03385 [Candidatus Daviesbacteria bacterium]|nr:hypothetical protein [Candidatus Daviesbacteria bacterium]
MKNNLPLILFNPKLPKLSKNEKAVLKLLVEAGKLIAPLYLVQEKQINQGISKEKIEKAAKKDPDILSPYTVLESTDGKIISVPYHIKYAKFLKPIAEKLETASKLTENKQFARFLKLQAKALLDGSYEDAIVAWLKMKPYILDISIGPVEHFDDRLFFAKASYQSWIGVVNTEKTKRFNYYKQIILSTRREALVPDQRLENPNRVKVKIDDVIIFSGHMARTKFVGVNMPMNLSFVEKYGSEITLFPLVNELRINEQILPAFNKIFSVVFRKGFSKADLRKGNISYIALHELAHNYLYYKNAAKNLQDLLSPIYELCATILGLRMAGSLLLKDIITNKELEQMVVAFICRGFYLIEQSKETKSWVNYATGGAIFVNYMIKSGALKQYQGLAIPNFTKIFVSLHDLSYELEYLLSSGTRKEAAIFIKKYGYFQKSRWNLT